MHLNFPRVGQLFIALSFILALSSCAVFKGDSPKTYKIDPVCGMKVDKSNAYTYEYEGKSYYFDTFSCKESFIMNPTIFLDNKIND